MSCCYCGKRVSMVRKRVDADFCCDEHREKYHARTRRSIETLREADEHIAVRRRLNEGIPLRPSAGNKGRELSALLRKSDGEPLLFSGMPTGLPVSRPILETHPPGASVLSFRGARRTAAIPPPRAESA